MVLKTTSNPFWLEVREGALSQAAAEGIDLSVSSTEDESQYEEQNRLVENYLERGAQGLIFAPNHHAHNMRVMEQVSSKAVPMIIIDVPISKAEITKHKLRIVSQIYSDNEQGGRLAAKYLAQNRVGPAAVGLIAGRAPGESYPNSREEGFEDELRRFPSLVLKFRQHADWSRKRAREIAYSWLTSKDPPDVIFAASDYMALGVLDAEEAIGAQRVFLLGYDATREGQKEILRGRLAASIAQDPVEMGRLAVEYMAKHLRGSRVPENASIPVSVVYGVRELRTAKAVGQ